MATLKELQDKIALAQSAYDAKVLEYGKNKQDAESALASIKKAWNIFNNVQFPSKTSQTDVTPNAICNQYSSCPPTLAKYNALVDTYNTNKNYAEGTLKKNLDDAKQALKDFQKTDPHQQTLKLVKTIAVIVVVAVVIVGAALFAKKKGLF